MIASLLAVNAGAQCGASDGPLTSNTATALLMHSAPVKATAATAAAQATASSQAALWVLRLSASGT